MIRLNSTNVCRRVLFVFSILFMQSLLMAQVTHAAIAEKSQTDSLGQSIEFEEVEAVEKCSGKLPYVLTIGGGYSPSGNQISLEKNVFFFQNVLADCAGEGEDIRHDIYYSDGDHPGRDLQYKDEASTPELRKLITQILGYSTNIHLRYRSHKVNTKHSAVNKQINAWFDTTGKSLVAGDRLIIYYTGHGGRGSKKEPYNTSLQLWNREVMTVKDLNKQLDKLDPEVQVTLIMVQCFSGGFAGSIYEGGEQKNRISSYNRCGFYSTVHSRTAAGCTPHVIEADYQDYSTSFFAALRGKDRVGRTVESTDYDGDGKTCFAEAHAYTVITSNTIDLPIKTSDVYLRKHFKNDLPSTSLVSLLKDSDKLLAAARPADAQIIRSLATQLFPADKRRRRNVKRDYYQTSKTEADSVAKQKKKLAERSSKLGRDIKTYKGKLRGLLLKKWPELENPWSHVTAGTLMGEESSIVKTINSAGEYKKLKSAQESYGKLKAEEGALELKWVKLKRLIYVMESVAMYSQFSKPDFAGNEHAKTYLELVKREAGSI